ncbi:hypothetical protein HanRHA438_Chr17g0818871 [Helianthus annuus]|nr:hypothetical protein HanIR_Chr17g0878071 [Helianthus annuus]KAJ0826847.1 hypothetical protein HanRHA438_Chr17g0818871 [Helianthus annuus]
MKHSKETSGLSNDSPASIPLPLSFSVSGTGTGTGTGLTSFVFLSLTVLPSLTFRTRPTSLTTGDLTLLTQFSRPTTFDDTTFLFP